MMGLGIIAGRAPTQSNDDGAAANRPTATAPVTLHAGVRAVHEQPPIIRPTSALPAHASASLRALSRGSPDSGLDGMSSVRFRPVPSLQSAPAGHRPDAVAGIPTYGPTRHCCRSGVGFRPAGFIGLRIPLLKASVLPEPATCASFHRTGATQSSPAAPISTSGNLCQAHGCSAEAAKNGAAAATASLHRRADDDAPRTSQHTAMSHKSSQSSQKPPGLFPVSGHHLPTGWGSLLGDTPSSSSSAAPLAESSLLAIPAPLPAATAPDDGCQASAPVAQSVPTFTALRLDHSVYLPHLGVIPEVRFVISSCICMSFARGYPEAKSAPKCLLTNGRWRAMISVQELVFPCMKCQAPHSFSLEHWL